jgi:uncharacterized tellurite resistance protein B-like protein
MIIFGTRGVTYSAGSGEFFCPRCRAEASYSQKRVRRFFTLYFIPLIPLDQLGEYVECGQCRGTFELTVLDYDPAAAAADFKAEFHRAVARVMVEMMVADGRVDERERQAFHRVYRQLTGSDIPEPKLQAAVESARQGQWSVTESLAQIADSLNDNGKETLVKAAYLVAVADDDMPEEERKLIADVGAALGMTGAHIKGVISAMQDDNEQRKLL